MIDPPNVNYGRVWGSFDWLKDEARSRALSFCAGSGSGKSYSWAKGQLIKDFLRGIGGDVYDPTDSLWEYFCDELLRITDKLPEKDWLSVWSRVHPNNLAGTEVNGEIYITPNPLFRSPEPGKSWFESNAVKFPECIKRIDPALESASIEGYSALRTTAINVASVLAPLGFQITEAESLIREPHQWKKLLKVVAKEYPESAEGVAWVRELMSMKLNDRLRKTGSFLAKIEFLRDPVQRAIYGANHPGFGPYSREKGHLYFHNSSQVKDSFVKMLSLMLYLLDFIRWIRIRGPKPEKPVLLVIDELYEFTRDQSVFSSDLQDIVSVIGRRYGIWSTFLFQTLEMLDPEMQSVMLSCNNHVIGACPHRGAAITLAEKFFPYRPGVVKHRQPIYAGSPPEVIDYREEMYTPQEWTLIASRHFTDLKPWRFLVKGAQSEGDLTGELEMMNLEGLAGRWPNKDRVERMRQFLARRDGVPMSQISAEIDRRQQRILAPDQPIPVRKKQPGNVTLNGDGRSDRAESNAEEEDYYQLYE